MTFIEEYSRNEQYFGTQYFRFVVSDCYEALFQTDFNFTGTVTCDNSVIIDTDDGRAAYTGGFTVANKANSYTVSAMTVATECEITVDDSSHDIVTGQFVTFSGTTGITGWDNDFSGKTLYVSSVSGATIKVKTNPDLTLATSSGYISPGSIIQVESEKIKIGKYDSTNSKLINCVRGYDSTTSTAHTAATLTLLTSDGLSVDCFEIGNSKKEKESVDGKFSTGELEIYLNGAAAVSGNDELAKWFTLECADININRFCALFYLDSPTETPTTSNCEFSGKIDTDYSSKNLSEERTAWAVNHEPLCEYNFTAYSIDISIFDLINLTGTIENAEYENIPSVYDRIETSDWESIFKYRLSHRSDSYNTNPEFYYNYYPPLGNLYSALELLLSKAQEIFRILINDDEFTIELKETSDIGIKTNPTGYYWDSTFSSKYKGFRNITDLYQYDIGSSKAALKAWNVAEKPLTLIFGDTGETLDTSSYIYIHRRMVDPELGLDDPPGADGSVKEWQKNRTTTEKAYGFQQYSTMSDLLFAVARSLGCYLDFSVTGDKVIEIELKPRSSQGSSNTYFFDETEFSLDTSSEQNNDEANQYYSVANDLAANGLDIINCDKKPNNPLESENHIDAIEAINKNKDEKNIESQRLLFSTSQTVEFFNMSSFDDTPSELFITVPLGLSHRQRSDGIVEAWENYGNYLTKYGTHSYSRLAPEMLTNAIFVRHTCSNMTDTISPDTSIDQFYFLATNVSGDPADPTQAIFSPANQIYAKIGENSQQFDTLALFINQILATNVHIYTTEADLTVPFLNAFSRSSDGSNPKWNNIDLNDIITRSHTRQVFNTDTCEFNEETYTKTYIVNAVERNSDTLETKLKLIDISNYAYGDFDGTAESVVTTKDQDYGDKDGEEIKYYVVERLATVNALNAVMLTDVGEVVQTIPQSANVNKTIGVALDTVTGDGDKTVRVKTGGKVYDDRLTLTPGSVYVIYRADPSLGESNISQDALDDPTENQDLEIKIGDVTGEASYVINKMEIIVE